MEGTRTPQREQTNKTEICHNEPHLVLFDKYFYDDFSKSAEPHEFIIYPDVEFIVKLISLLGVYQRTDYKEKT